MDQIKTRFGRRFFQVVVALYLLSIALAVPFLAFPLHTDPVLFLGPAIWILPAAITPWAYLDGAVLFNAALLCFAAILATRLFVARAIAAFFIIITWWLAGSTLASVDTCQRRTYKPLGGCGVTAVLHRDFFEDPRTWPLEDPHPEWK